MIDHLILEALEKLKKRESTPSEMNFWREIIPHLKDTEKEELLQNLKRQIEVLEKQK